MKEERIAGSYQQQPQLKVHDDCLPRRAHDSQIATRLQPWVVTRNSSTRVRLK